MNPFSRFFRLIISAAYLGVGGVTSAQWVATPLLTGNPLGSSVALGTNGTSHSGFVGTNGPYPHFHSGANSPERAVNWTNDGNLVPLQPDLPSQVFAMSGPTAGGGIYSDGTAQAAIWNTPTQTLTVLHPAGYVFSRVTAISGTQQVGLASSTGLQHAVMWSGSANSMVDLHPSGAVYSGAGAIHGNRQGGLVSYADPGGSVAFQAAIWTGSADSFVNLNPAGSRLSEVSAITDTYEAGYAYFDNICHAGLWFGSAESFVSLLPEGFGFSRIAAVAGDYQGGMAGSHAAVWQGTAASYVSLQDSVIAALGVHYTRSEILGGSLDEFGQPIFVGYAHNSLTDLDQAMVWRFVAIPEPSTYALLALGTAIVLVRQIRRSRRKP